MTFFKAVGVLRKYENAFAKIIQKLYCQATKLVCCQHNCCCQVHLPFQHKHVERTIYTLCNKKKPEIHHMWLFLRRNLQKCLWEEACNERDAYFDRIFFDKQFNVWREQPGASIPP